MTRKEKLAIKKAMISLYKGIDGFSCHAIRSTGGERLKNKYFNFFKPTTLGPMWLDENSEEFRHSFTFSSTDCTPEEILERRAQRLTMLALFLVAEGKL